MTVPQARLSKEEHDRILYERIIPEHRLEAVSSHDRPQAFIVAAQPGTCTGWISHGLYSQLQGDVIRVEPDELTDYHPCVAQLRRDHPLSWNSLISADAESWAEKLVAAVMAGRKNLIVDFALTNGMHASADFVEALEASGYVVEVLVVVAHPLESELGLDKRFTNSMDREGYGRHLLKVIAEESYENLPARLDAIKQRTGAVVRMFKQ